MRKIAALLVRPWRSDRPDVRRAIHACRRSEPHVRRRVGQAEQERRGQYTRGRHPGGGGFMGTWQRPPDPNGVPTKIDELSENLRGRCLTVRLDARATFVPNCRAGTPDASSAPRRSLQVRRALRDARAADLNLVMAHADGRGGPQLRRIDTDAPHTSGRFQRRSQPQAMPRHAANG